MPIKMSKVMPSNSFFFHSQEAHIYWILLTTSWLIDLLLLLSCLCKNLLCAFMLKLVMRHPLDICVSNLAKTCGVHIGCFFNPLCEGPMLKNIWLNKKQYKLHHLPFYSHCLLSLLPPFSLQTVCSPSLRSRTQRGLLMCRWKHQRIQTSSVWNHKTGIQH